MDKKSLRNKVIEIAEKSAENLGYEIVDVEFTKGNKHDLLSIFIYKKEGIDLDDCTKMSHSIEKDIDSLEILKNPYYLEISSPGLDRPLKTKDDYRRNLENEVDLKLFGSLNDKKEYSGILKAYDEEKITLEVNKGNIDIPIKSISSMKQSIKF
ncbi:ribosome maturation factor RimP [Peptoniphilus raoultii]|uniref:ribosome maturation factor RimP n=1 Tax=Peptoniphilus raoultii TaxID=1776387 RepID=UPI0008DB2959|nr:ribosome maturation factor RimP [Peptoniphilus raoultii]